MRKRKLEKLISCVMATMMVTSFIESRNVFAAENAKNNQESTSTESKKPIEAKERVSVHDPSIVKDGDTYYVFGSHIEAAKSTDLQNWTKFTNSYETPDNVLFGDLSKNLAGSFKWAGEDDSDCKGGFSVWAPNVVWNKDYVNEDGTSGAYMMYYCTSSTYKRSAIGFATSKTIEGPYTYGNTILYSGFTKGDSYDSKSTINTNYENTNIKNLIENGSLSGANSKWFTKDGQYNTSYAPNAIDPEIFWDEDGTMWMNYGSWSGGIYMVKIDPKTGDVIYPGNDENADSVNPTDRYFGTRIGGGYTKSGEGSEIVYDKETGYYYLYMSYAGLAANGGYNIRMFRSKNPDGPYLDAAGNNAALSGSVDNSYCGIKLIGNYKFACQDVGYKAAGHNSSFIDSDGQMYLVYHTRFNGGTEEHQVRVHQMFINEEGWPVVAPYENSGDKISETGYSKSDIVGNYQFINHGTASSSAMLDTLNIKLNEDNTVTGDVTGTWSSKDGSYYMDIVIDGVTYKGVFFKQQDESNTESKVMTFTAVGSNNECVWGSKLDLNDSESISYAAKDLENKIPSVTKKDITLPKSGAYDTNITWSSSDPDAMDENGAINRKDEDKDVTLTANITKGDASISKTFTVTVEGKLASIDKTPIYNFDFEVTTDAQAKISSTGRRDGEAQLVGQAEVKDDSERGRVLSIKNKKGAIRENYLSLPSDTFSNMTSKGYTVSMWVNVNSDDPNYFEHSALFEANDGGKYPVTRISANLYGRINADAYSDATEISKPLRSNTWEYVTYTVSPTGIVVYVNGEEVGRQDKDISACFKNNILAQMTDVTVGSGNIWSDADIADARFDDVAVFDSALNDKEVEALYNEEAASEKPSEEDKDVAIETTINENWDNNVKETIKLTNISDKTIENWALKARFDGEINEIWNAEIESHDGDEYVIKNSGWPRDLKPGESVEFGFITSYENQELPKLKDYQIVSSKKDAEDDDYEVDFTKSEEWENGFNGTISIANKGSNSIENWQLEFDYADTIKSLWNADIVSHEGNHYVIKAKDYNADIKEDGSVSVGFEGVPAEGEKSTEVPQNYKLTEAK